jgi:hypothetical protein
MSPRIPARWHGELDEWFFDKLARPVRRSLSSRRRCARRAWPPRCGRLRRRSSAEGVILAATAAHGRHGCSRYVVVAAARRRPRVYALEAGLKHVDEDASLGDEGTAGWEDGVHISRRWRPPAQHRDELILRDVRLRHRHRCRRDPCASHGSARGELDVVQHETRTDRDGFLLSANHERPFPFAIALVEGHQVVRREVFGRLRLGSPREVARAREVTAGRDAEPSSDERRVVERASPHREVEPFAHDVDAPFHGMQMDPHVRVLREVLHDDVAQNVRRQRRRRRHAQHAAWSGLRGEDHGLGVTRRRKRARRMLEVSTPLFCQTHRARRAHEQGHPQAGLEVLHAAAERGLSAPRRLRRRSEALGVDHGDKRSEFLEGVI